MCAPETFPRKDNFWTQRPESQILSGKPWAVGANPGKNCELNAIIATMSGGPVGIADKAGTTNKTIVLRSTRSDGLIMQPDRPITFVDAMFAPGKVPTGSHLWGTYADVELEFSGDFPRLRTFYLLSIDMKSPIQLSEKYFYAVS
eukprot:SAG11_NODE_10491_length_828_cov_0.801097_1_plen_145_part_00